jgi:choline-sulfatase
MLDITKAETKYPTPKHAKSLISTALKPNMKRAILSEFHDYGAQTGMFMLRKENWKLILYPGFQSQLFNLAVDPNEIDDLAGDESYAEKISELKSEILKIADPKKINKNAFEDQEAMIQRLGGREAILAVENFDHTPVETG